ncbi:hypothetical protein B0H65DRAFT_423510 [Neurospora tetraspora]|uniref:Uncharacterized protein n=1 Tax=Neurospora tetraspora TaxID=94610 RepID=A0AAE0MT86_9PEZI|nr:hypothetical protein B0H65DRAFT_423510 [Neurospora tetraspora]
MPCQCKACLDQLASPQWLWFHEQQHHANHKILACPHCDTILPTKAKYFPADNRKLLGQLLRCPSCNRQDHLHLFLRRQTAFACGFCSASFHSSSSSSSPHSSSAAKTTPSSSSISSPSDSHKRAKRRFFTHLATELARNDELIEQGQPPREWSRTNVIYGLLQRPGIVKHWRALVVGSKDKEEGKDGGGGAADMCMIPPGLDAFFSWDNVDALVHTDMDTDTARVSGSQLEYFDPVKDGDAKAAKLAELAFEQADKVFGYRAGRVETKIRRNDPGSVGNQSDEKGGGEKKVDMDKPLPELPTGATSSSSSTVQPTGLRSTDCRRNRDRRRREDEDNKTRRRVRNVVKQIEMALSAAYR